MALPSTLSGAGLGLLAFGAYSAYDVSAKLLGGAYHPLQIIAAAGLMTMPLLLIYALLDRGTGSLRPVRPGLMALRSLGTILNFVCGVTAFTLLPLGILQLTAAIENGYWYARSAEFMQQPIVDLLVWMRVPADTLFSVGALALAWFVFRLWVAPRREAPVAVPSATAVASAAIVPRH